MDKARPKISNPLESDADGKRVQNVMNAYNMAFINSDAPMTVYVLLWTK